ncbi:hypothetical protein V8C42DRAFT_331929 [Trichoderma barbatum]
MAGADSVRDGSRAICALCICPFDRGASSVSSPPRRSITRCKVQSTLELVLSGQTASRRPHPTSASTPSTREDELLQLHISSVLVSARRWQNADKRMDQWLVSPERCKLILSAMPWPSPACMPPQSCPVISAEESLRRITVHYLHARRRRQCHASARFFRWEEAPPMFISVAGERCPCSRSARDEVVGGPIKAAVRPLLLCVHP